MQLRRMKGFAKLTKVDDAVAIVMKTCGEKRLGSELVEVQNAWGRVLEEGVTSPVNVPPFNRSAVDGYAIKSVESFSASQSNPAVLHIIGLAESGHTRGRIGKGESFEIYTGAPMPSGADAVAMAEDCERSGGNVKIYRPAHKFSNVSLAGEDIRKGELVLACGTELRPWHLGVLASIGRRDIEVRKKANVGVVATGSELVDLKEMKEAGLGMIVDSGRPMIIGLLEELGCEVVDGGIVPDDSGEISSRINEMARNADMIITLGGSSVGGKDLVPEALENISKGKVIFHGLAVKPGKPTGFGVIGVTPVFMLPGYPVSAMVGFEALIVPLISRWSGLGVPRRERVKAVMAKRVATSPGIRHFLRVRLTGTGESLRATPIALTGSGLLSSITKADGLVIIPEDLEGLEEGELVEVELLRRPQT